MGTTSLLVLLGLVAVCSAQDIVRWCVMKGPEMNKCNDMKTNFAAEGLNNPSINCTEVMHESQCLRKINADEADVKSVGDRGIYTGGNFQTLKPVISETRGDTTRAFFYKSVIVLKKNNTNTKDVRSITDVKGKKSCHTGVMRTVGWVVPVGILFGHGGMAAVDCENNVKNVANHFSQSCAPGAYSQYNNPDQDNPGNVCQACDDKQCPFSGEKYSSYNGAFRGVVDDVCDIAFVKHSTVPTDAKTESWPYDEDEYELLCPNGSRTNVRNWDSCNWATRPHNALVARSDYDSGPLSALLDQAVEKFGPNGTNADAFQLFSSSKYGGRNLMFSDSSQSFVRATASDYKNYLGDGFINSYEKFRGTSCRKNFRWCTIKDAETKKCKEMSMAMGGGRITQDMTCVQGTNVDDCMTKIKNDQADLITVDAGHVYTGGKYQSMRPISAELYDEADNAAASYYAVAIIKKGSGIDLRNMKGKKTCHTGFGRTAGWNVPVGFFAARKDINLNAAKCNAGQAAANFFGDMCTPGAQEGDNAKNNPAKLCSLCPNNCGSTGMYSGYNGAVKCMMEKGADVAFAKHTTIDDILNGNYDWARGWTRDTFELACRDGSRRPVNQWQSCNLARVPSHAVITSTNRDAANIRHYQIALYRAQTENRYRSDTNTFFALFASEKGQSNLLFKDSTKALRKVTDPSYENFLGPEYLQTVAALDPRQCTTSKASVAQLSLLAAVLAVLVYLLN